MFDKILVPTDGSELSVKTTQAAVEFARQKGGKLIAMSVLEPYPFSPLAEPAFLPDYSGWERENEELAHKSVGRVGTLARAAGVTCETQVAVGNDPADEIIRVAGEHDCDAIFMASHGRRGLDRLLLGSVTQRVLLKAAIPVVVFR